jgi:hypothetical protein
MGYHLIFRKYGLSLGQMIMIFFFLSTCQNFLIFLIKKYTYLAFYQEYKICKEDKGGGFLVKSGSKDKKKYSVCV